ncbi:MAG: hypothetical protein RLZZ519_2438 [Bacteroidota bacterium]|jgi:predicted transposase/invertase (TIGR01784 family)
MEIFGPKYINPYTDFGFKKLFGEEGNKDLLIDFLNQLLPERHQIASLTFRSVEMLPELIEERKAFFDIHCLAENGESFIVEMQKAKVRFFKDRALFYTSHPIREQATKGGDWDFQLDPIYFIAILDFVYDESLEVAKFRRDVCLRDQDSEEFYDKLHFKFLQMPAFKKEAHELVSRFDKWCYFLKNLESFHEIPQILSEPLFKKAFMTAEVANFTRAQRDAYEQSVMDYIGIKEVAATAWEEGKAEGKAEGALEEKISIVLEMAKEGFTITQISKVTKLEEERINQIITLNGKP